MYPRVFWCFSLLLLFFSCQSPLPPALQEKGEVLLSRTQKLHCEDLGYQTKVDSLWDVVSTHLEKAIPADAMRDVEKANAVQLRNTSLIKMVWRDMDAASRILLDRSGKMDSLIANRVKDLQVRREQLESEQAYFIDQVAKEAPEAVKDWTKKLIDANKGACD
jgi:hypothetical protein